MHRALLLAALATASVYIPAWAIDVSPLELTGHGWEDGMHVERRALPFPDDARPTVEERAAPTSRKLSAVGEVVSVQAPLVWDPGVFSLSWYVRELELVEERRVSGVRVARFSGGRFTIYVDGPYEPTEYGTHPPNETVPSTFSDGFATYLDGIFKSFELTFQEASGFGTIEAVLAFTGGTALPWIEDPESWRFDATIRRGAPMGYSFQLSRGFLDKGDPTTTARSSSWGSVKARYR